MLAQQQQLNLTAHARCFITSVKINDRRFIAMVDSGATDNFMIRALVEKEGYSTQKKPNAYNLVIVDGNPLLDKNERVNKETKSLPIAI
jgi:predicted aspartyl protease